MLWGHYESCGHPCWQLFVNNASAFNEESGEIALSVLARDISRGGVRSDCKKVSQTFALVKAKTEVAQDMDVDLAGMTSGPPNTYDERRRTAMTWRATAAFLRTVIRQILAGTYRHYDKDVGFLGKGGAAARPTVGMQAFPGC